MGAAGGGGSVSELWPALLKGEGTLVLTDTAVSSFVGSPLGISTESAGRTYLLRLLLKVSGRRERAGGARPLALPRCMALIILQSQQLTCSYGVVENELSTARGRGDILTVIAREFNGLLAAHPALSAVGVKTMTAQSASAWLTALKPLSK